MLREEDWHKALCAPAFQEHPFHLPIFAPKLTGAIMMLRPDCNIALQPCLGGLWKSRGCRRL